MRFCSNFSCSDSDCDVPVGDPTTHNIRLVAMNETGNPGKFSTPVLKVFDSRLPARVVCDASNFCVGGVLE